MRSASFRSVLLCASSTSALVLGSAALAPASAWDLTGNTTSAQTVGGTTTGTVESGVTLSTSGSTVAVTWSSSSTSSSLTNYGTITTSGSGRAFDAASSFSSGAFTLTNAAGATLSTSGTKDALRIDGSKVTLTGAFLLANSGTVAQTNTAFATQATAIDMHKVTALGAGGSITIENYATGVISSANYDAIEPGAGTEIDNWGTISSTGGPNTKAPSTLSNKLSASDGIDISDGLAGVVINNYAGGSISGARHGITQGTLTTNTTAATLTAAEWTTLSDLSKSVVVTNYGTITGNNGSGVGSDASGTVTNWGTITGTYAGDGNVYYASSSTKYYTNTGDGDGVDIDFLAEIENHGTIQGTGAAGTDSTGNANLSEGLSIGGGSVHNYAGATISGYGRGITVTGNDVSSGVTDKAYYAVDIVNEGTIAGLALNADGSTGGAGGSAIRIYSDQNNTITNSGTISGAGSEAAIWFIGSGNDTITNSGTIVATGTGNAISFDAGDDTLNIRSGSSITGTVDGGAGTDTIDLSGSGTTAAPDVFAGAVNFETMTVSSGVWRLTGSSQSYSGGVTVASGATLDAAGTVGSTVTVTSGATLAGTGSVDALLLSGIVAPGSLAGSIGTLSVTGDATVASGSTVKIDADATGAADRLAVGGTLTIGGGSVVVTAASGNYAPSTEYVVATAASVVGTFSSVSTDLAFLTPSLSYSSTAVTLTLARNATLMQSVASGGDQRSVAAALDTLPTTSALYLAVVGESASAAQASFTSLSTGTAASSTTASLGIGGAFSGLLGQVAGGTDGGGLSVTVGSNGGALGYAEDGRSRKKPRIEIAAPAERVWQLWAQGFGAASDRFADASAGTAASSARGGGGVLGLDHRFGGVVLGLAVGGSHTSWSVSGSDAAGTVEGFHIGPYASFDLGAVRLGGALTWSALDAREHRTVTVGGSSERVVSSHRDDEWRLRLEADRRFAVLPDTTLTPYAVFETAFLRRGAATETLESGGSSTLGLAVEEQTVRSAPLFLGLRAERRFALADGGALTPSAALAWVHEFSPARDATAAFVASPSTAFAIEGARAASDSLRLEAGVTARITDNLAFVASGESEFSDRGRSVAGRGSVRISW